jgi:ABC-type phosphate/phosphonate transport system substrate-binding protein
MKKILSLFLLLVTVIPVFALYTIKGKIIDANTQNPLDFVNVALFKENSEIPATGVTWRTGLPLRVSRRMRQVFMASVWPPWLQNPTQ